jgi:hypothetical protein
MLEAKEPDESLIKPKHEKMDRGNTEGMEGGSMKHWEHEGREEHKH